MVQDRAMILFHYETLSKRIIICSFLNHHMGADIIGVLRGADISWQAYQEEEPHASASINNIIANI